MGYDDKRYALQRYNDTNEIHIFECVKKSDDLWYPRTKCVCGQGKRGHFDMLSKNVLDEGAMRLECAKIGRAVCGNCVATLYTTYSDD